MYLNYCFGIIKSECCSMYAMYEVMYVSSMYVMYVMKNCCFYVSENCFPWKTSHKLYRCEIATFELLLADTSWHSRWQRPKKLPVPVIWVQQIHYCWKSPIQILSLLNVCWIFLNWMNIQEFTDGFTDDIKKRKRLSKVFFPYSCQ